MAEYAGGLYGAIYTISVKEGFPILVTKRHCYRALGPELIPGSQPAGDYKSPPGGRQPLLSARPAVTFPATLHHRPLAGTKLHCLVTEVHRCEQLARDCYAAFAPRICTHDLLTASPMLYPLYHCTTLTISVPLVNV